MDKLAKYPRGVTHCIDGISGSETEWETKAIPQLSQPSSTNWDVDR
jgi:hypothetical protein